MPPGVFRYRAQRRRVLAPPSVDGVMSRIPRRCASSYARCVKPVWFRAWFWESRPQKPTRYACEGPTKGAVLSKRVLTVDLLCRAVRAFAETESEHREPSLFGVTDGKAVGTYLEHKFQGDLHRRYVYQEGSSAKGIDFPGLGVDLKVTSHKQPQSSCPYESARQKLYGLGYSLLVFVYDKTDEEETRTARLNILHTIYVTAERTADFQTTTGIRRIVENSGNVDDLLAFFSERMLPVEEIEANRLAE